MSGNTFGGRRWTDAYAFFPMLPDYPMLTRCNKCKELLWRDELEYLGELPLIRANDESDSIPREWHEAEDIEFLSLEEYFEALAEGKGYTEDHEIFIRMRIWWCINDPQRWAEDSVMANPFLANDRYRANQLCLIELLAGKDDDESHAIRAEIYREMCDFTNAALMLDHEFDQEFDRLVARMMELIENRDCVVREF